MNLFQLGSFTLRSGQKSNWKIECDALTTDDWMALARMAAEILPPFRKVYGVPRGGIPFATCLEAYAKGGMSDPILIAEDVVTTGNSMVDFRQKISLELGRKEYVLHCIGVCVFARSKCLPWVTPLFQMGTFQMCNKLPVNNPCCKRMGHEDKCLYANGE